MMSSSSLSQTIKISARIVRRGASSELSVSGRVFQFQQQQQQQVESSDDGGRRYKHSSRQIKRLFKNNPARVRVEARMGIVREPEPLEPAKYEAIMEAKMLPNGWSALPGSDIEVPEYPFRVTRTKNKPNDAVGFLPVYSEYRYVSLLFAFFYMYGVVWCQKSIVKAHN
jgi:hypothetical protein